ncbi:type II CAAX endopeptidase family protein [Exiguobacterium sp. s63]|uniref:type II CAAX endopeptidase family protein n=1 Tax=Exiguobacterium sp. s63 TaxID=2751274 RepID=UPI001BE98AF0|nr:type II CAAX endopeptidase family protein [Exiguobacterium sp. s63]
MYKNKFILFFLLIAFGYSWVVWMSLYWWTDLPIMAIVILGAFGPSISGILTMYRLRGGAGVKHLLRTSIQFKMSWKTYAIPFVLIPFLFLVAYWWTDRSGALIVREPWWVVPYFLYMLFLGGTLQEEYGWRGYLLDALQSRLAPLWASLTLGIVWTLWHVPLFFMIGTGQRNLPFWAYGLAVMAYTILITWVYNGSSRNLWSAFLMHTMFNVMLVMVGFEAEGGYPIGFIHLTIILWTAAIIVIWKTYGKLNYEPLEEMLPSYPSVTRRLREGKE